MTGSAAAAMGAEASGARGQRRRALRKAKRARHLTKRLVHDLAAPDPDQLRALTGELNPVLRSLRRSILQSNGPHAELVADGIDDLASAFAKLVQARQSDKPGLVISHLTEGTRALEEATRKARKAGDAWPL